MNEYAGRHEPRRIEDLDNEGTLFEAQALPDEVERLVDTQQVPYGEARTQADVKGDDIEPVTGVHVSLAHHYVEELMLLRLTGDNSKLTGLQHALRNDEIAERFGQNIERVSEGATRKVRVNNQLMKAIYHTEELKRAGFDAQDVDDGENMMRMQYRHEYAGPENASKRATRRRYLHRRLAQLGHIDAS